MGDINGKVMAATWFVFFAGLVDVLLTIYIILTGLGHEINPTYTWIPSRFWMLMFMLLINLVTCLVFIPFLQKYKFYLGAYAWGMTRLTIGAGSAILILVGFG